MLVVLLFSVPRDMFVIVVYVGEREGVDTSICLPVYLNVQARTYFLFLRIYGKNNSKNMGKLCMKEHESTYRLLKMLFPFLFDIAKEIGV